MEYTYRRYVYPTFTERVNRFFSEARTFERVYEPNLREEYGQIILKQACGIFSDINVDLLREDVRQQYLDTFPRDPRDSGQLAGVEIRRFIVGATRTIPDFEAFLEFIEQKLLVDNGVSKLARNDILDLCRGIRLAPLTDLSHFDVENYLDGLENLGNTICNLNWQDLFEKKSKISVLTKGVARATVHVANTAFGIQAPFIGGIFGAVSNAIAEQIVTSEEIKSVFGG